MLGLSMDESFSSDGIVKSMYTRYACSSAVKVDVDELLNEGLDLSPVRESPDGCSVSDESREEPIGLEESYIKLTEELSFKDCEFEDFEDYEQCPEMYNFEDFQSELAEVDEDDFEKESASSEPDFKMYDFLPATLLALYQQELRVNGKELHRARTLPSIPVSQIIDKTDIPTDSLHGDNRKSKCTADDSYHPHSCSRDQSPLVRWCSREDCYRLRSSSVERRSKNCKMLPRCPTSLVLRGNGTAWTLGGDGTDNPYSSAVLDSPSRTPQFYYTTPPKSQMASTPNSDDRRLERRGSAKNTGFSRLARRLSQKERRSDREERKVALRQRSVSLDCGENRRSLLSPKGNEGTEGKASSIPPSPSMPSRLTAKGSNSGSTSPNIGRLSRRSSGWKRKSSSDLLEGTGLKAEKKKTKKKKVPTATLR